MTALKLVAVCAPDDPCEDGYTCDNHREATRDRGAPEWHSFEEGEEPHRDYLEGRDVHCGDTIELQGKEEIFDDWGSYSRRLDSGELVRYERSGGRVLLYTRIKGHEFVAGLHDWMRFRWPVKS